VLGLHRKNTSFLVTSCSLSEIHHSGGCCYFHFHVHEAIITGSTIRTSNLIYPLGTRIKFKVQSSNTSIQIIYFNFFFNRTIITEVNGGR